MVIFNSYVTNYQRVILRTHQKSMEWHQEAMAQLIEDFLLGKFSGRGLPPKK
jgi:hypothetical protein